MQTLPKLEILSVIGKQIRVLDWVKNLLVFLPYFILPDQNDDLSSSVLAFVAFCFASSFSYVVNDLLDRKSDKNLEVKKLRPYASGRLKLGDMVFLSCICLMFLAFTLNYVNLLTTTVISLYVMTTSIYSAFLKRYFFTRFISLLLFYSFRLLAGFVVLEKNLDLNLFVLNTIMMSWLILIKIGHDDRLKCVQRWDRKPFAQISRQAVLALALIHLSIVTYCTNRLVVSAQTSSVQKQLVWLDVIMVNVFLVFIVFHNSQESKKQEIIKSILSNPFLKFTFFMILMITTTIKFINPNEN